MRKIFRKLISVEDARYKLYHNISTEKLDAEKIVLQDTLGRVLADNIYSQIDVPPFDRGSMDGFAVIASDLEGAEEDNPIKLRLIGEIKAGYVFNGVVEKGTCVEISTGAPLPTGADAVIMVEYSAKEDKSISFFKNIVPGDNIMTRGTDISKGELIVSKGTVLTSRELSVIAATGKNNLKVIKQPKVGVFSSGDEIIELGNELLPGKLYDINATSIISSITEIGCVGKYLGIIPDEYEILKSSINKEIDNFDMIIISGGTSAGMGDMLYEILDTLGPPGLLVHGVKVKPGKPTILSVIRDTPIIGLPGYPASALSIFKLFGVPYLRSKAGLPSEDENEKIDGIVKQRIRSVMGRYEFKPVNLIKTGNELIVYPVPGGSGAITSIALADGFIEIPENTSFIEKGSKVTVSLFSKNIKIPDLQIIGSVSKVLWKAHSIYSNKFPNYISRIINISSTGGIAAIRRGEAHISGISVLNNEGEYNKWVLDTVDGLLISGITRKQGIVVKKGNPKQIYSIADLKKAKIINRKKGSNSRILLDLMMNKIGIQDVEIEGYNITAHSEKAAINAVRSPDFDATIAVGDNLDKKLDFIALREEKYDFLIGKKYLDFPPVKAFIEVLLSDELLEYIKNN